MPPSLHYRCVTGYYKNSASAELADRTLFTSAHVEYLAAVIFYLLA